MKFNNETKIGILVVVVIAILSVLTWKAGDYEFRKEGYRMKVRFKNIDGIELNAPVTLSGFEIGRVEDIEIIYAPETLVELTIWLEQKAKVREGSRAYVKNMGFMGEKYVGLTFGNKDKPYLHEGAIIMGQEPGSFEEALAEGQKVIANLQEITTNVKERLRINKDHIDDIVLNTKDSMRRFKSITTNVDERLTKNKELIDDFIVNMNSTSQNLEEMSYDLKINPWKLMYKEPKRMKLKAKEK